jgi:hypothetical protein
MGWKTDWLYSLVFAEIGRVWARARKDADSGSELFAHPPDYLLVREYAAGDPSKSVCLPPIKRAWVYRGAGAVVLVGREQESFLHATPEHRGAFYSFGTVGFHIADSRAQVVLLYSLGPRYGRGAAFAVHGQGGRASLTPIENSVGWQS